MDNQGHDLLNGLNTNSMPENQMEESNANGNGSREHNERASSQHDESNPQPNGVTNLANDLAATSLNVATSQSDSEGNSVSSSEIPHPAPLQQSEPVNQPVNNPVNQHLNHPPNDPTTPLITASISSHIHHILDNRIAQASHLLHTLTTHRANLEARLEDVSQETQHLRHRARLLGRDISMRRHNTSPWMMSNPHGNNHIDARGLGLGLGLVGMPRDVAEQLVLQRMAARQEELFLDRVRLDLQLEEAREREDGLVRELRRLRARRAELILRLAVREGAGGGPRGCADCGGWVGGRVPHED